MANIQAKAKYVKSMIEKSITKGVRRFLRERFQSDAYRDREYIERAIPKIPLREEHMRNCELLLNRASLLSRLKKDGVVAEIGVADGAFSENILAVNHPVLLHLIDMWATERYNERLLDGIKYKLSDLIADNRICLHQKRSIDAADDFEDNYFDWIYIDTDHSYHTTKNELLQYSSKVKHDGIIAGHDYVMSNWISSCRYGVVEAVHEFCVTHEWELIYLTLEPTENQSFAIRRIK